MPIDQHLTRKMDHCICVALSCTVSHMTWHCDTFSFFLPFSVSLFIAPIYCTHIQLNPFVYALIIYLLISWPAFAALLPPIFFFQVKNLKIINYFFLKKYWYCWWMTTILFLKHLLDKIRFIIRYFILFIYLDLSQLWITSIN